MNEHALMYIFMIAPLVLELVGLIIAVLKDPYINRSHRRIMIVIVALLFTLIAQNYLDDMTSGIANLRSVRTASAVYGYSVRPVIIVLFCHIVDLEKKYLPAWILTGINCAVHLTAFFSNICISYDADNFFYRGPLGYTCHIVSAVLLCYYVYLIFQRFQSFARSDIWIPFFNILLIIAGVLLDALIYYGEFPTSFLNITLVNSNVFYYIWLHQQFVREHEDAMMSEQRVQIMLTQIKPHFLYNSLGAIEELCDSDPALAKKATVMFSKYLRGNMDSISSEGAIPFERELAHTRLYLELEQLRFEDALTVKYDIACEGFSIPSLTLEPLAENAVRHGIRKNADGVGTVTVSAREYADRYEVSVSDNGPGFDVNTPDADGGSHIGIQNVRDRLSRVCKGELRITSETDAGTTATIILPKNRRSENADIRDRRRAENAQTSS